LYCKHLLPLYNNAVHLYLGGRISKCRKIVDGGSARILVPKTDQFQKSYIVEVSGNSCSENKIVKIFS